MTRKRSGQSSEYAVSDEAAAYIADALMEIALQFEASHLAVNSGLKLAECLGVLVVMPGLTLQVHLSCGSSDLR